MDEARTWDRRGFLTRIGLFGAAGAGGLLAAPAAAAPRGPIEDVVGLLRPVLDELARDTMTGLSVFVCPGPDAHSLAQGTRRGEPGAVEAGTPRFLLDALNKFMPLPDELLRPAVAALVTALSDAGVHLPILDGLPNVVATLDKALAKLLQNNATVPLPVVAAALLNLVATGVKPAAATGPLGSPFSRLSFAEKATVFSVIEAPLPDLVAVLDVNLPQPFKASLSGLLKFLGGALLEFAAFGSYSEFAVFDPVHRRLTARPVGWTLSGYQPDGPVEGWDEFLGYYQGRQEVRG
ncbi:hypothetical protein [Sciscionella sediminilitoris]|uniref:hypothetical protein n=1 Tax=Sciscionella sediminilitoris TaxID=1445613 RepID=UPI0004DEF9C0|nr:hypothetical protein [Sciscionella sp. SE31]